MVWIDTHCHLDAPEFDPDRDAVRQRATEAGVTRLVLPSVRAADAARVRDMAHQYGDAYALGIHPLYTPQASADDLQRLESELAACRADPRLVAIGEIGLDGWVPGLDMDRQEHFYRAQLRLARRMDLPVILHVRRSADRLLKGLREVGGGGYRWSGIAHAFNGSRQQAEAFVALGFKLGFGGAVTFERALQLRRLAVGLPLEALVLESDAPDIPPQWLYTTAEQRRHGSPQGRNEPAQVPGIASVVAGLRGLAPAVLAQACLHNATVALPRLGALLQDHRVRPQKALA